MMKVIFSRTLLALVARSSATSSVRGAETPHTIRIGVPDQSAGSKPRFIEGRSAWRLSPSTGRRCFKPQGVECSGSFQSAGPAVNETLITASAGFCLLPRRSGGDYR